MYSDLVGSTAYQKSRVHNALDKPVARRGEAIGPDTLSRSFMSGALRIEAPTGRHYFGAWIL